MWVREREKKRTKKRDRENETGKRGGGEREERGSDG